MTSLTPIAPLLTCEHITEDRREEFTVWRESTFDTLNGAWNKKFPPERRTAAGFEALVNFISSEAQRTGKGTDLLPVAGALTGLWAFIAAENKKDPASLAMLAPAAIQKTRQAFYGLRSAEGQELFFLAAPMWQWMRQNFEPLLAYGREQGKHVTNMLDEAPTGVLAGRTLPPRSGLITAKPQSW